MTKASQNLISLLIKQLRPAIAGRILETIPLANDKRSNEYRFFI